MVDKTDWYDDFIREEKIDKKNVELTDSVDGRKDLSTQEDIIELTDIVEDDNAVFDMDSTQKDGFETGENLELEGDISFKEGLEPEMDESADEISFEPYVAAAPALELSVTQEQLEASLDRVIEKKIADKIDILLVEGMEKAIKKEIAEIKERLQKDLDLMGNV